MKIKKGDIYPSRFGNVIVVSARKWDEVVIVFEDTGYRTVTQAGNVERGTVKDPYSPSLHGVGFFGEGRHKAYCEGKVTKVYNAWANMITRCYSEDYHIKKPTYKDCIVCDDWHNFQNFADWYVENKVEGMQLDKDKLSIGEKIYSPETCSFISAKENSQIANSKRFVIKSPDGEIFDVFNLSEFCRNNDLSISNMNAVCLGKRKYHKGWTSSTTRHQI